jgi:S-adenosylmethionine-diacylglycerol 3-amino-3-carboxypropyl transferase
MLSESTSLGKPVLGPRRALERGLEQLVFHSGLTFNQTWEDPAVDGQALALGADDIVFTIASAGDNVLAYTLAGAGKISAIDLNPAQIHLLNLKIAAIQHLDYPDYWHLFSLAPAPGAGAIYLDLLRPRLDLNTRLYWDAHLGMLSRGLYRAGMFGHALWLLRAGLRILCGRHALEQYFEIETIDEQAEFYFNRIHSRWWNPLARPFAQQLPVLLLFGAHLHQIQRVRGRNFGAHLEASIRRTLSSIPARDNYFWQQALLGRYLVPPPHLRLENFARLKESVRRIETGIGRAEEFFLRLPRSSVTRFNLLDAPDWLSPEETTHWWTAMGHAAAPGARVLFRTIDPDYHLPAAVLSSWRDMTNPDWLGQERTGVYAGIYAYVKRT